jgi:hypothetical protein
MASGDYVEIKGAEYWQNNGVFPITYINVNSYSYTLGGDPGASPTATPIKATFVAISGTTDINGEKEVTRVYPSDQPVVGWIRVNEYYKTAKLFGTVDSVLGYDSIGVCFPD